MFLRGIRQHGQTDIPEMIQTLRSTRGCSSVLNSRKNQRHQHGDDRNHNQQLNQRKRIPISLGSTRQQRSAKHVRPSQESGE
jgi:hypothetical protein